MAANILIIEDDGDLATIVRDHLTASGHTCTVCKTGADALAELASTPPDVVLCDLMLPDCPGEVIVKFARSMSRTIPIIIMSARTSPRDKVDLLSLGADDYLGKPFDLNELTARVSVQLRHAADAAQSVAEVICVGPLALNRSSRELAINGLPVPLTRTEFNILLAMACRPNRVFTRPELYEAAWKEPYNDDANTVNAHIFNLRNKLKAHGADSCLATVWGVGFRLIPSEVSGA